MSTIKNTLGQNLTLSERTLRLTPPPITWLIQYDLAHPEVISLAAGLVDYASLPTASLKKCVSRLLEDPALQQHLQYGTTQGKLELRQKSCEHFKSLESTQQNSYQPEPEHCVITTGSQQLLSILADVFLDPGDIILVEAPTYFVFLGVLETTGARIVNVTTDEDGIVPNQLRETLQQLKDEGVLHKVKCLYAVDYFQNPTGRSLSEERKPLIVDIVKEYSNERPIMIIEDSAYRPISFDNKKNTSLKSYDPDNEWVIYTATFSKSYSPGIKLGYGLMPDKIRDAVLKHKGNQDFGTANFNQALMVEVLQSGEYDTQVAHLKKTYRHKAEVMHDALVKHIPKSVQFSMPKGGMYFWLTFPDTISTAENSELFKNCLKNNVLYVPGEFCYFQPDLNNPLGLHEMRLAYGTVPMDQIEEGIKRLGRSIPQT